MITKLNPNVIQDGSITAEKLADGIANDIISSLSTQSTLPSLTDYYIGQNAGGRTETYFKKTLQSIGSVFQHELYDKVYLKDGSDPTFGNITAWQLNLSENSYVTHADGFGLALSVNDCAFLVGEEGGVYYLDDAGNTQTMLHSGNIGNYNAGSADFALKMTPEYLTDLNSAAPWRFFDMNTGYGSADGNKPNIAWVSGITGTVAGSSNYRWQLAATTGDARPYFRQESKGGWGNWNTLAFTSDIPTKLSQLTDDVVAGKYLPLSGGELNAGANISWGHSNAESWASTAKGVRTLYSAATMNGGSPSKYSAGLHIAGDSNFAFQMAYNPASAYVLKYRGFDAHSAAWNDWKQLAFTSDIPTKLSQLTDDVVAGKYLPLSGGTVGEFAIKAGAANSATIKFSPNSGAINHWLGVNSAGVLWFSNNGWSQQYDILHSGNIGNYEAGSSVWSKGLDRITSISAGGHCVYFYSGQPFLGDDINNAKEGSNAYHLWSYPVNGTIVSGGTANIMNLRLQWNSAYLHDIFVSPNFDDVWHRSIIDNTCNPWRKFAFTDSNVASATKLQTPRTLWGQSFDGTNSISGTLHIGGDLENAAGGIYIHQTNEINSFNGNLYLNHRGCGLSSYGSTNDIVMVANGGKVGIGTNEAEERLDVIGNIRASGNILCSNLIPTGVINQLNNNSYIVHNAVSNGDHKMWITDGTGKSISAGNAFNLDAINIISDKSLVLGAQLDYNIRVLKANNRIAKVIDSVNYSTLLPYKTPVAISNTYSSNPHNVAMADNTLYIVNENESDDRGCTILSFPTNDGSTPLTCGLLYTTYADSTGEFSCPTVIWSYNITPLMEPEATFEMWFTSYDGGTTWYGTHTVYK